MRNFVHFILKMMRSQKVDAFLERISLSKARNQQIAAISMGVLMALLMIGSIAYSWARVAFAPKDTRDYRLIPFDMYDAALVCNGEMVKRLGDKLVRSYVDDHSTRLDNREGIYRVYLKADVGTIHKFHEIDVYCFVDKWDRELSHYKEIDPESRQIMTSDLKFFKN